MARPKKTSLDYFSVDVDIVQDLKVRKLLRRKGGARALGVFVSLLCQIYKNGYYVEYNEDMLFVIASDLYEEEGYVKEIIEYCLEVGLFDQTLYEEHHVLTSHGIQERYVAVQTHYKRISVIEKYNLLDDDEPSNGVSSAKTSVSSEETQVNAEETSDVGNKCRRNPPNPDVSSELSTQKKKEKENKNKFLSSTTAPAREESAFDEVFSQREGVEAEVRLLLKDAVWVENISSRFAIPHEQLEKYLDEFRIDCLARGKLQHTSEEDVKSHFSDWLRIQIENQNNSIIGNGKPRQASQGGSSQSTDLRRSAPVTVGARQKDFSGTF